MVEGQLAARGIRDARVLAAMARVPRHDFVPEGLAEFAYDDTPLPIESGQTISQPYIVALMIEAAAVGPDDRVLDVGTGSGYAAAALSLLAREVWSIERQAVLCETAAARLARLGYDNVHVRCGDGTRGWPEAAPFDAILVAAGGPSVPETLKRQLAVGGRLVVPVGREKTWQRLVKVTHRRRRLRRGGARRRRFRAARRRGRLGRGGAGPGRKARDGLAGGAAPGAALGGRPPA
jgi:protein-L-isoaspartate(D-aspartate) O-methyltransferase